MTSYNPHFQVELTSLRQAAQGGAPKVLDGRRVAEALLVQVRRASGLLAERGVRARLAVVRVGDDPASAIYVRHKIRACEQVGIDSEHVHLPADISQEELLEQLGVLNRDASVHGVLLQLPLSAHHRPQQAIMSIDPRKDVDGFHPHNMGCLMVGHTELEPCTPRGIMTLLAAYGVEPQGKHAVVVGRSMIVGRPMAQMLVRANATVTACHQFTRDLESYIRQADMVVVATGVAGLIKGDWVKPGAVICDVGMTRRDDGKLVGDVEFDQAIERAGLITPVPGGVGPMTVATLMENTIRAACTQHEVRLAL